MQLQKINFGLQGNIYKLSDSNKAIKVMYDNIDLQKHFDFLQSSNINNINGIIKYHKIEKKESKIYITMDLYNTDLFDLIVKRNYFLTEREAKIILRKIVKTLNILHKKGYIHRDIKPENILLNTDFSIDENTDVVLCDLEAVAHKNGYYSKLSYGTTEYLAPEARYNSIHTKLDIYSLGKTIWKIIGEGNLKISDEFKQICTAMMEQNVEKRVDINEIFKNTWLFSDSSLLN